MAEIMMSVGTKLKIVGVAAAHLLAACAAPPTPIPEVIAVCPDITDPQRQGVVMFNFKRANGTVTYSLQAFSGSKSTRINPGQRLQIPGQKETGVDLDIPYALVTDNTGAQAVAAVNLSDCVTEDPAKFKRFFDGVREDQINPGPQAYNGKDWRYGPEAKARTQRMLNPDRGINVTTYIKGSAGPIFRRG